MCLSIAWFPIRVTEGKADVQCPGDSCGQCDIESHSKTDSGNPGGFNAVLHQTNGPMALRSAWRKDDRIHVVLLQTRNYVRYPFVQKSSWIWHKAHKTEVLGSHAANHLLGSELP